MAEETWSELVEACNEMDTDELADPSLESRNAYEHEADFEPSEEQREAMDKIIEGGE